MNSGLSPNLDVNYPEPASGAPLSIALIGPDTERRSSVASALATWPGAKIREFPAYPPDLDDVPRMLTLAFDVIVIDLDSNPDYAIQVVENICSQDPATVMVYSATASQDLMARSRQAGAREYLEAPFDQRNIAEALTRATSLGPPRTPSARSAAGKLLVFFGAKGGAGTTAIAGNYAIALAQESKQRTLLIDLGQPLGDAALSMGLTAERSTEDALKNIDQLDPSLLEALVTRHPSGASVLAAPSKVPDVPPPSAAIDKLIRVARAIFDFVVVDLSSRVDLMNSALMQDATTTYMVTQAGISELRNAERLISRYFNSSNKKLEIVVNRFSATSSRVTEEQMTSALGRPVRWKVPDDSDAIRMMHNPESQLSQYDSAFSRTLVEMAGSVTLHPVYPERNGSTLRASNGTAESPATSEAPSTSQSSNPNQDNPAGTRESLQPIGPGGLPNVFWETPESIVYGTPLDDTQLNARAAVPGNFVYTPGPGYVLPVGTHTLWVTFNPESGPMVQSAVSIAVAKAMPEVTWPVPRPISCDTPLSEEQLNASVSAAGTVVYSPAIGKVLTPGEHTLTVTFTPSDSKNFSVAKAAVSISVEKLQPSIEWITPDKIPCGGALGGKQLNATASVPGKFTYSPGAGEILEPGEHTLTAFFTPTDAAHYDAAQVSVKVIVKKAPPRVTWAEPDPIVYGTPLSTAQLNASATVEGSFVYNPGLGAVLSVGEHTPSVTFRPIDDADYADYPSIQAAVPLTVLMARPTISWARPEPMPSGVALSANELNATASVPGTFVYKPVLGEVLPAGEHTLTVIFTPVDTMNYEPAKATVSLTVAKLPQVEITWPAPAAIPYGTALSDVQLNASASIPGTFAYGPCADNVLPPGRHTLSAAFTPEDRSKYSVSHANATIQVEPLPDIAPLLTATMHQPIDQRAAANPSIASATERAGTPIDREVSVDSKHKHEPAPTGRVTPRPEPVKMSSAPKADRPRETRIYKGVVYEKGEDGQWHRQQK